MCDTTKGGETMKPEKPFDHAAFMKDEDSWPHWPVLPVKNRSNGDMTVGVMLAGDPTVFLVGMFDPRLTAGFGELVKKGEVQKQDFETFEAAHDAGWIVD